MCRKWRLSHSRVRSGATGKFGELKCNRVSKLNNGVKPKKDHFFESEPGRSCFSISHQTLPTSQIPRPSSKGWISSQFMCKYRVVTRQLQESSEAGSGGF
jgi:hypothetical protein